MNYKYAVITKASTEEVFGSPIVWGIEVTNKTDAARCAINIDPQHDGSDATKAAIEVVLTHDLPPDGAILVTNRADLDSVCSMAVLEMRRDGYLPNPYASYTDQVVLDAFVHARIKQVADSDKFAVGKGKWEPRPLPSKSDPWPVHASTDGDRHLAAIAAEVSDFNVPLEVRVSAAIRWLLTGETSLAYQMIVVAEREAMIAALESGEIKYEVRRGVAVVHSTHRAGTSLVYSLAPVGVVVNPQFRAPDGTVGRKITICAWNIGYADLRPVWATLSEIEAGWGGQPTIGGSPVPTRMDVDVIIDVINSNRGCNT